MERNKYEHNQTSLSSNTARGSREPRSHNENSRRDQYQRRNHSPEWRNSYSQRPHYRNQRDQDSSYRNRSDNRDTVNSQQSSQSQSNRSNYRLNQRRSRSRERSSQLRPSSHNASSSSTTESRHRENIKKTERQQLLEKWRKDFCTTGEDMKRKLEELEEEVVSWIRSSPADIYYSRVQDKIVKSTPRLDTLCNLFENLIERSEKVRAEQIPYNASNLRKKKVRPCRHTGES